jgi:hypothetical protein
MTQVTPTGNRRPVRDAGRDLVVAWTAAVLVPVLLVAMVTVGSWVADQPVAGWLGDWAPQTLGALLLVAATVAVWFGLRARRHGRPEGIVPAALGGAVGGLLALLLLVSAVAHFVFGFE